MGFGIKELVVILIIVVLVFGTKKIKNIGGDVGGWIRDFRKAMKDDTSADDDTPTADNRRVIEGEARTEKERV
ncbi:MAG: twin-arginine translocase TatA/TatE family subunit [Gammaproteobacteria bacterium]